MNICQLLELQGPLQEQHRPDRAHLSGNVRDVFLLVQDLLDFLRNLFELLVDGGDLVGVLRAARLRQGQAHNIVRRNLRQEGLCRSHTDLGAGVGVQHSVGFARDLGTVGVAHSQDARILHLRVADGL